LISNIFAEETEVKLGIMETVGGVGLIMGPVIGGVFYSIGGYVFVFIVYDLLLLVLGVMTYLLLPSDRPEEEKKKDKNKKGMCKLAFNWKIMLDLVIVIFGMGGPAFLEPVLASHINSESHYSQMIITSLFGLPMLGYALAVKIQSMLPRSLDKRIVLLLGLLFEAIGFLTVGPWPGFHLPHSYIIISFGLFLIGCGSAWAYLPTLPHMIHTGLTILGYQDREYLSDTLSGIMGTCHYLGEFTAPLAAGFLTHKQGFHGATGTVGGVILLYILFYTLVSGSWKLLLSCKFTSNDYVEAPELELADSKKGELNQSVSYEVFDENHRPKNIYSHEVLETPEEEI
jgi:predicted MFS family arabinose efflux permease